MSLKSVPRLAKLADVMFTRFQFEKQVGQQMEPLVPTEHSMNLVHEIFGALQRNPVIQVTDARPKLSVGSIRKTGNSKVATFTFEANGRKMKGFFKDGEVWFATKWLSLKNVFLAV